MGGPLDDVAIQWFELCDTAKSGKLYMTQALQAQVYPGGHRRKCCAYCMHKWGEEVNCGPEHSSTLRPILLTDTTGICS